MSGIGWPQVAVVVFFCIELGMQIEAHGKPKKGNWNAWSSLVAMSILMSLLYAGGFFSGGKQ